jgi:transposase-like protein
MSTVLEGEIKRWTARRKAALLVAIIQAKTTIAEASRAFDIPYSEIGDWVDKAKKGMENVLRTKPMLMSSHKVDSN